MRIAVLTLTRDRLAFTQHCLTTLHKLAGCAFDHYILDQGSTDETPDWLLNEWAPTQPARHPHCLTENIGISRGLNLLLETINLDQYDVIVKLDNDCELVNPDTLRDVCHLAVKGGAILSPRILGLNQPPKPTRTLTIDSDPILDIPQIGGIFLAAPAWWYAHGFRFTETNPPWGMDDVEICAKWRQHGGTCGYVERLQAWHYLGTDRQRTTDPAYFKRKDLEHAA